MVLIRVATRKPRPFQGTWFLFFHDLSIKYKNFGGMHMLDIKVLRNDTEMVKKKVAQRGMEPVLIDDILRLDKERRALISETEELKSRRNKVSQEIAVKKKNKEDAEDVIKEMRDVGEEIKQIDARLNEVKEKIHDEMSGIPNWIHDDVPEGEDDTENVEVRRTGEIREFEIGRAHV